VNREPQRRQRIDLDYLNSAPAGNDLSSACKAKGAAAKTEASIFALLGVAAREGAVLFEKHEPEIWTSYFFDLNSQGWPDRELFAPSYKHDPETFQI
jgi:hypothetical protein